MIEGVSFCGIQRRVSKTEHLVQHIPHCTELVIFHRHAALQLRDHHTNISVHWLKGLQLQLALMRNHKEMNKAEKTKAFFEQEIPIFRGQQEQTLDLLQSDTTT